MYTKQYLLLKNTLKDMKEDSLSTSFTEMTQKITQLEARFTGPLNPSGRIQQETNKHIQPVRFYQTAN